jgi:putative endonuclease
MANNIIKGRIAESIAVDYLQKSGYLIKEVNWRHKKSEIDIICTINDQLIFCEVKSRSTDYFGAPEFGVTEKKKSMIVAGATSYMDLIDYDGQIRFDFISIILHTEEQFNIEHFEDAFFPGL